MAEHLSIAIVGGGWAGLAAAVTLTDAGRRVVLFESARQLGGRARRVDWNGLAIDNGQHLMAGAYRQTFDLMARLGSLPKLARRRLDLRAPGFRLALPKFPAPLHLAAGLMHAEGLSLSDKLAAARFMQRLKHSHFRLDHDIPASDLLNNHRQPHVLVERLWEPICVAALNTPLAAASGQVFCNVLRDSLAGPREASDMLFNQADMGRLLPDAAARFLTDRGGKLHLASKVAAIRLESDRFVLDGVNSTADCVIVAAHPARVPALLQTIPEAEAITGKLRQYRWQPIATLWLRFASPIPFPYPMVALGHGTAPWAFDRSDIAPGVVAIVASAEGPHLEIPAERLLEHWQDQLTAALGPLPGLQDWKLIVEKRATYACMPGLPRPDNVTPLGGLYLAGDYTAGDYPATLESAVQSGVKCARLILERT
jgi:squalene-associated FAD-dependent desaturase